MRVWAHLVSDFVRGFRVPVEDMAIAALVMLPFTFAVTLWVNSMAWWPAAPMLLLGIVVQLLGTFWNAGWRARTAMAVVPVPAPVPVNEGCGNAED